MKKLILILMVGSVYSQCLGDMNNDGIKDILDIVNLVNDILDGDDVCEGFLDEFNVESFSFYPNPDTITYNLGEEILIQVQTYDESGVGVENVPVRFSLTSPFNGVISDALIYTNNNGTAGISYYNHLGGEDILKSFILNPLDNDTLLLMQLYIHQSSILGCTDPSACNFDPLATIFDNSCEYVTCHICYELTEVELWGEYYDIESTTSLDLYSQELTGSIPPEIGCLTNLTKLWLFNNHLTGEIPPEIGNLTNLDYLWLQDNQLTGEIPVEIGNLTNLGYLELQHNQLTGEIPPEIGNLTNLTNLFLHNNQLTGEIPPEVCDLIESIGLDIDEITINNNLINTCE